jgi:UDP-2,3-diacylglucosamine hydrolase
LRSLFISDLHLSETRPEANERFIGFLEGEARGADALYILGDLFEYWIGDDDLADPFNAIVVGFLKAFPGGKFVMHGNRDFLLGSRFSEATGAQALQDPSVVDLEGEKTLLMHGDTLCTDDVDYQAWRRTARSPAWQADFLSKPLPERRQAILELREKSREVIQAKPAQIMDVSDDAVRAALRRHGVSRLVHGHTHRPGRHALEVDGRRCERWVLPDWYGRGGYLELERAKPRLVRFK